MLAFHTVGLFWPGPYMDSLEQQLQQVQKAIVRGQPDFAGRILNKLRQTHASSSKVWLLSAAWYQSTGDHPAALDALGQAAAMGLSEPAIRNQVADAYMSMQAWPQALKLLQQLDPEAQRQAVAMSRCEWGMGRYQAAIDRLQTYLQDNPEHPEANLSLWQCLERMGQFDESDQQRERCQPWSGHDPVTTIMDNAFLVANGEFDKAAERLATCRTALGNPHPGIERATRLLNQLRHPGSFSDAAAAPPKRSNNPGQARQQALDEAHRQSLEWLRTHDDLRFFASSARLMVHALEQAAETFSADDWYLEFGVFHGRSLNILAQSETGKGLHWHGFDSFEGLPEDWSGNESRGSYSTAGQQPDMPDNVTLHPGWFEDTLPEFIQSNPDGKAAFLHIDCDLYSSTQTVLEGLREHCQPGTVLQFDELIGYPGYREHEWKAWEAFLAEWPAGYRLIGSVFMGRAVAVRLN